jgi:hypothetical protein
LSGLDAKKLVSSFGGWLSENQLAMFVDKHDISIKEALQEVV